MPSSEQENGGGAVLGPCSGATAKKSAPFRFAPPRCLIDWRALNAVDLGAVVRDTDVDSLEGVLDVVAFGDIEAEDYRTLTPANFIQLFRTAQLTVNYLLHVQDRLASDSCAAKGELARAQQRVQLLGLKAKELREELAGSRKEARHLKKSLRTLEAVALTRQAAPAPEVRVVERVVEVADVAATRRLEAQVAELEKERAELQRENRKLSDALEAAAAAADTNAERAAEKARQEERQVAVERLRAAVEAERQKRQQRDRSSPKLSVVVANDEVPELRARLAAAQRRERDAERRAEAAEAEAARAATAAGRAAAGPAAEVQRLQAQLEAAAAESDMLRSQLAARERERSPTRRGARLSSSGSGGVGAAAAAAGEEMEVLQREVERQRGEKAALKEENRRLRQQAAQDGAEVDHLTRRLQQLAGGGSRAPSRSPSPVKPAMRAAEAGGTPAGAQRSPGRSSEPHAASQHQEQAREPPLAAQGGGIGSPIDEPAAAGTPAAASAAAAGSPGKRPGSSPGSARKRRQVASPHAAASPHSASPRASPAGGPSAAEQRQFRRELQHTLHNAERPGVVSRFPHSLGSFLVLRPDLESELEAEMAEELRSYGLSPGTQGLTDRQLSEAGAELERRRAEARRAMSPGDRQRYDYMRATIGWHVQRMAELADGQREASPASQPLLARPPFGLKPIRTASKDAELSPRRRGFVEQVLDQVGDEAAVYSPLGRGASVLSEQGYLHPAVMGGGAGTPRSVASTAGLLLPEEGGGTPRSPWSVTHDRVFHAAMELEGRGSPLGQGATASVRSSPQIGATSSPGGRAAPWQASLSTSAAGAAGAAAGTSPSKAAKSVHFVARQEGGEGWRDDSDVGELAPAQRMGRRPASGSYRTAQPAARRLWKEG